MPALILWAIPAVVVLGGASISSSALCISDHDRAGQSAQMKFNLEE